jgi:hypothetical protein
VQTLPGTASACGDMTRSKSAFWKNFMRQRQFILAGGALCVMFCLGAAAQDAGTGDHGIGHDKWHQDFYAKLRRNDGGGSCCSRWIVARPKVAN